MANTELGAAYVTVMPSMKGFQKEVAGKLSGLGSTLSRVGKVAGAVTGIVGGIGFASLARDAVSASDATEKFRQTLDFAGLDTSAIDRLSKSTRKYADETIYDLSDIQSITAQLASNSVRDYDRMAEAAGNLNAAAGGTKDTYRSVGMVLTQTAGLGKLTTENWNQLSEAIPGASGMLQDAMLKNGAYTGNFREAMEKGEITAEEFNQAILDLGFTDAARQAATSTTTIEGALGNMAAAAQGLVMDGFDKIKPAVTDAMNGVTAAIEAAAPAVLAGMDEIGATVSSAAALWDMGGTVPEKFRLVFSYARQLVSDEMARMSEAVGADVAGIAGKAAGIAAAFAAFGAASTAASAVAGLAPVLVSAGKSAQFFVKMTAGIARTQGVSGVLSALRVNLTATGGALSALASPAALAVGAVAGIAAAFAYFYTSNEGFRETVNGIASTMASMLRPSIQTVSAAMQGLAASAVPALQRAFDAVAPAVMQALTVLAQLAAFIVPMAAQVASVVIPIIAQIASAVVAVTSQVVSAVMPTVTQILSAVSEAMPIIQTAVSAAMNAVLGVIQAVWPAVEVIATAAMGAVQAVAQTVWPAIQAVIDAVMGTVRTIIAAVMQAIQGDWSGAWATVRSLLDSALAGLKSAVSAGLEAVGGFFSDLPGNILSALGDLGGLLVSAGASIIDGLLSGLKSAWDGVVGWFGSITSMIPDLKGPLPVDARLLVENGGAIMGGLLDGLVDGWGDVESYLSSRAAAIGGGFPGGAPAPLPAGAGGVVQNFTFNQPVQTPYETARAVRLAQRDGLAADY